MKRWYAISAVCAVALVFCFCEKGEKNKIVAKVGGASISQKDQDAFNMLARYYPQDNGEYSLLARTGISGLVETEALFQKSRWSFGSLSVRRGQDWIWKTRYFITLNYTMDILQRNLGFSEAQIKRYYEANKDQFKAPPTADSTGKIDSTVKHKPFMDARDEAAKKLFLAKHKPDSAAFAGAKTAADSAEALSRWVDFIRERGHRDFFMNVFFKEKFGKPFPDSLKDIYGKNKFITPAEMDVILSWIPAERRDQFKDNPKMLMDFAGWLTRWKLFTEKAKSSGFAAQPHVKAQLVWAWKFELAQRFVNNKLLTAAGKGITLDTAMALYSCYDETSRFVDVAEKSILDEHLAKLSKQQAKVKFDSLVYAIRKAKRVKILKPEMVTDEYAKKPSELMTQADALRDTGKTAEAQAIYQLLVTSFVFTPEGKKALVELAKIQTEQQSYTEAIKNYRRYLVVDADKSKQCNNMFMIGFIYDEYLDRPEMAELNYKWVLKNAPECDLADDAEFMMLHLGEQMASVDELQAEVQRQGKKVEDQPADEQIDVEAAEQK